jgi:hypothetical protein
MLGSLESETGTSNSIIMFIIFLISNSINIM